MRRTLGEYLVLVSLAGSLAFWGCQVALGAWRFDGDELVAIAQIVIALGGGAVALWQLICRRPAGSILAAIFYGIQVLNVTLPSGRYIGFNSLPTVNLGVFWEKNLLVNLNVVSLVLFVFSLLLWVAYRERQIEVQTSPPNTSLERTRGR